jgi:hypothetical protein
MEKSDFTYRQGMLYYKSRPIGECKDFHLTVYEICRWSEDAVMNGNIKLEQFNIGTLKMLLRHDNGIRYDLTGKICSPRQAKRENKKGLKSTIKKQ